MGSFETLTVTCEQDIGTITINRPQKLNALNEQVLRELERAIASFAPEGELAQSKAVIVTGAGGKAFVAGADIKAMVEMSVVQGLSFAALGHRVMDSLGRLPQPVLAAVDGFALGGGLELALACDIIYATESSRFGQPEVGLGIIPGFGGTQRLSRLVGPGKARELIFTAEMIDAAEALRIGLVAQVYPREGFADQVLDRAKLMARQGPRAVAASKRAINLGLDQPLERACELEQQSFAALFATEDRREGMSAFVDKRKPDFQGK